MATNSLCAAQVTPLRTVNRGGILEGLTTFCSWIMACRAHAIFSRPRLSPAGFHHPDEDVAGKARRQTVIVP